MDKCCEGVLSRSLVGKCCGEVVEKCCREVLRRCYRDVLLRSVAEKPLGEVL